jgi:hypothetical protein
MGENGPEAGPDRSDRCRIQRGGRLEEPAVAIPAHGVSPAPAADLPLEVVLRAETYYARRPGAVGITLYLLGDAAQ